MSTAVENFVNENETKGGGGLDALYLTDGIIRGEEVRWLDGYVIPIRTVGPTPV